MTNRGSVSRAALVSFLCASALLATEDDKTIPADFKIVAQYGAGSRALNSDSLLSGGVEDVRRSPAHLSTQGAQLKPNGRSFTAWERKTGSSSRPSRMLERTPIVE